VFESGTRDDDVELLFTRDLGETMGISDDVDVLITLDIGAKILASVGNKVLMSSGARGDGTFCAEF
jgi:hypothetical protein